MDSLQDHRMPSEQASAYSEQSIQDGFREFSADSILQRLMDWLFGRDFFASYRWEDGRAFALALAQALNKDGFDCFLGSEGFLKGVNFRRVGDREVRKTSRLVLVGSPCVHESEAVLRELRVFRRTGRRVISVAFGGSLSRERFPESPVLAELDDSSLWHAEPPANLASGPSPELLSELKRTFEGERAAARRLRFVMGVAVALGFLSALAIGAALLAWHQYEDIRQNSATKDSQIAAERADNLDIPAALAYYQRSLEVNPADTTTLGAMTRIMIERPPIITRRSWLGEVADVQMAAVGTPCVLRDKSGGLFLQAEGGAWSPLSLRPCQSFPLAISTPSSAIPSPYVRHPTHLHLGCF